MVGIMAMAQVPQRFNKVVVTGDITSPKFIKTGSTADSVLLGNGLARAISTIKTDTVSLSNRINAKAAGNGTASGTNTGDETLTSIKTKLGAATAVSDGYLKYQDFVNFDGKLSSEVDGSVTNELQTISTTGSAGNITLSNSGGTLNLNVNDADASATNEIQDLSLSGNTLTLSSDATTVNISQATAVLANTAKVSNATHTGDVTGSTALTLKTVNSNVGTFNNVTINAKGLATAGSNVSYEPSFSKNTAFNKNFGTTPGTVLEGRTFGTAANSAVGDFIQNQNSSAQVGSIWVDNEVKAKTLYSTQATSNVVGNNYGFLADGGYWGIRSATDHSFNIDTYNGGTALNVFKLSQSGVATFSSTVNSTGFLLNGNNLTSSLATSSIPKWDGSAFVNATAGTDYQRPITLTTNGTSGAATLSGNVLNVPNYGNAATSGYYNPTITIPIGGNVNAGSAVISPATYTKIGNIYTVSVSGSLTSTTTGEARIELNLPATSQSGSSGSILCVARKEGSDVGYSRGAYALPYVSTSKLLIVVQTVASERVLFYVTGQYTAQ